MLQFALTELWSRDAATGILTWDTYQTLGRTAGVGGPPVDAAGQPLTGVRAALAGHAEQVWRGLTSDEQAVARRILLGLLAPGSTSPPIPGALSTVTSRAARVSQFSAADQVVVGRLVDARLLTSGRAAVGGHPTVEVAHEALVAAWPRLQAWVSDDREFVHWRVTDLAPNLERWQENGRDSSFLLPQPLLASAVEWLDKRPRRTTGRIPPS